MNYVNGLDLIPLVRRALQEDIGKRDITTEIVIPRNNKAKALLLAKEDCVVCGLGIARQVYKEHDSGVKFKALTRDGAYVKKGRVLAKISGKATSILTCERVALNFICFLSGIATETRKFVGKAKPYKVKIVDTRKTIPGLRELQKYAVRIGGGYNHRFCLDEMVMIKDNHLKVARGYRGIPKIKTAKPIECEVENIKEFKEALRLKPDFIMLDNMSIKDMKKAAAYPRRPKLEASGNITLKNIRKVASCGIDIISIGALTHSIKSVDISLEIL